MQPSQEELKEIQEKEATLKKELEQYKQESERLKSILGGIGGTAFSKKDSILNLAVLVLIVGLFIAQNITQLFPAIVSLEIGILLISVKIVYMIHNQYKVNHFQFWILNSIEFRINDISSRVKRIEKKIDSE